MLAHPVETKILVTAFSIYDKNCLLTNANLDAGTE